jgi:hypothetical protein
LISKTFSRNFDILIILLTINLFLHGVSFFINNTYNIEYFISALRILLTFVFFRFTMALTSKWIKYLSKIFDIVVYLNCIFVVISVASDLSLNTNIVSTFNRFRSVDTIETFRFGGVLGGYQIASYLIFLTLVKRTILVPKFQLTGLILASFLQSRSILLVNIPLAIVILFKKERLYVQVIFYMLIIYLLAFLYQEFNAVSTYIKFRLLNLFTDNYSARDTISIYYNIFTVKNVWLGDGVARFSEHGGGDGFYSKLFIGVGILPLVLMELVKFILCLFVTKRHIINVLLYLVIVYFDLKGDLFFTSIAIVAFLVMVIEKNQTAVKFVGSLEK